MSETQEKNVTTEQKLKNLETRVAKLEGAHEFAATVIHKIKDALKGQFGLVLKTVMAAGFVMGSSVLAADTVIWDPISPTHYPNATARIIIGSSGSATMQVDRILVTTADITTLVNPTITGGTRAGGAGTSETNTTSVLIRPTITGGTRAGGAGTSETNTTSVLIRPTITGGTRAGGVGTSETNTSSVLIGPTITGGTRAGGAGTSETNTSSVLIGPTITAGTVAGGTHTTVTSDTCVVRNPTITGGTRAGGAGTSETNTSSVLIGPTITAGTAAGGTHTSVTNTGLVLTDQPEFAGQYATNSTVALSLWTGPANATTNAIFIQVKVNGTNGVVAWWPIP